MRHRTFFATAASLSVVIAIAGCSGNDGGGTASNEPELPADVQAVCDGPLELSPSDWDAVGEELRGDPFADPSHAELAIEFLRDDAAAREKLLPLMCESEQGGQSIKSVEMVLEEGHSFSSCVDRYLDWCYSPECYGAGVFNCPIQGVWSLYSCPSRSAAYCGVRCLYNGCNPGF